MSFVHLHLHSEFSLVDGLIRPKTLPKKCADLGMPAVALTDRGNLFGLVKFYRAAIDAGVKPLIGADIAVQRGNEPPFRLILLAQNQVGYRHLTTLLSRHYQEGWQQHQAVVNFDWLTDHSSGLIALSAGVQGELGRSLLQQPLAKTTRLLSDWQRLFPDRFYLTLTRTQRPDEAVYLQKAVDLAKAHSLPVVATNEVCFLQPTDFEAHEARVAIQQGYALNDSKRPKHYSAQQYLRSVEEMHTLFADIPSALANSVEIARRCNAELTLGKSVLPAFPIPANRTETAIDDYFATEARVGLGLRTQTHPHIQLKRLLYDDRLETELTVISKMGFAGYFLIVADFIRWAKQNDVPVGPGRGSGAGSLVAFALGITDLDPIPYDLLFERFLNPERVSMPDFDIDFCMDGRDRVIEYVGQRYGRERVAQIATFGTLAARMVVRDVGRVLGHNYGFIDRIAKLIPNKPGLHITLREALEQVPDLKALYDDQEEVRDIIDLAQKLEGLTRNVGKHAGGVVIAPTHLYDFAPLYTEASDKAAVTQFDKDDVELAGLVKFDFLGLRTLTLIDWAVKSVNDRRAAQHQALLDMNTVPLNDRRAFELLRQCETTAVFQLESTGIKELLRRLAPTDFEDIVALVALYRPGPLQSGMVDDFINRKHGRAPIAYPHPALMPVLKPTYGVILYQEQVMQIAQVLAGYSLGGADLLRRAMGKKKPEEMAKQRQIFTDGAKQSGVDLDLADEIFDLMEKFAGYGFNKSHSAAYAVLTYQTAWLKAHFRSDFMAAVLSSDMDKTDKVTVAVEECRRMQLVLLPPSVNHSLYKFFAVDDRTIRYGLGAIKGMGEEPAKLIIESRQQQGPFTDLFDFCARFDSRKITRRTLEGLIFSGAFDEWGINRPTLFHGLDGALGYAEQARKHRHQVSLFSDEPTLMQPALKPQPNHSLLTCLQHEQEALGLFLSGHPLDEFADALKEVTTHNLSQAFSDQGLPRSTTLAGLVTSVRPKLDKQGRKMAFITLSDPHTQIELRLNADVMQSLPTATPLAVGQVLVLWGDVKLDGYTQRPDCFVHSAMTLDQLLGQVERLNLSLGRRATPALVEALRRAFADHLDDATGCFVRFRYDNDRAVGVFNLPQRLRLTAALFATLKHLDGVDRLRPIYGKWLADSQKPARKRAKDRDL